MNFEMYDLVEPGKKRADVLLILNGVVEGWYRDAVAAAAQARLLTGKIHDELVRKKRGTAKIIRTVEGYLIIELMIGSAHPFVVKTPNHKIIDKDFTPEQAIDFARNAAELERLSAHEAGTTPSLD